MDSDEKFGESNTQNEMGFFHNINVADCQGVCGCGFCKCSWPSRHWHYGACRHVAMVVLLAFEGHMLPVQIGRAGPCQVEASERCL